MCHLVSVKWACKVRCVHMQLKREVLGSIPGGALGFFSSSSWLTNIDEMKDLWCSSTVRLLSTQI